MRNIHTTNRRAKRNLRHPNAKLIKELRNRAKTRLRQRQSRK